MEPGKTKKAQDAPNGVGISKIRGRRSGHTLVGLLTRPSLRSVIYSVGQSAAIFRVREGITKQILAKKYYFRFIGAVSDEK